MPTRKTIAPTSKGGHAFKWAHIERLKTYRAPVMATDHHGTPYVADPTGGPWTWDLRCQCGHEWSILETAFPGKRKLRSCGRPECPHSRPAPARKREPKEACHMTLDRSVVTFAYQYAAQHNLNYSAAFNQILQIGIETIKTQSQ